MKGIFLTIFLTTFSYKANAEFVYLFDVMRQSVYQKAWKNMVKGEQLPPWVEQITKKKNNYVAGPVISIPFPEDSYECFWICKPHNCGNENMKILFAPNATKAWGILIEENEKPQWLGHPDNMIKKALQDCDSY
jgi:hypothetical protein